MRKLQESGGSENGCNCSIIRYIISGGRGGRDSGGASLDDINVECCISLYIGVRCDSIDSVMLGIRTGSASKCCFGS